MPISRKLVSVSRTSHIYLSIALLILVFFSVTGITLNHTNALTAEPEVTVRNVDAIPYLPLDDNGDIIDSPELAAFLEGEFGLDLKLLSLNHDAGILFIDYHAPGRSTLVEIDGFLGKEHYESTYFGLIAVLNDLHKARDTDVIWKWLVDASGVLLVIFSIAGFILLLPNQYRFRQVSLYSLAGLTLLGTGYWLATI